MANKLDDIAEVTGTACSSARLSVIPNNDGGVLLSIIEDEDNEEKFRGVSMDLPFDFAIELIQAIEKIIYEEGKE